MPVPTSSNDVTLSICMPRELRLALEQVRLGRGQRGLKLPSVRALIEEAVRTLVAREARETPNRRTHTQSK